MINFKIKLNPKDSCPLEPLPFPKLMMTPWSTEKRFAIFYCGENKYQTLIAFKNTKKTTLRKNFYDDTPQRDDLIDFHGELISYNSSEDFEI